VEVTAVSNGLRPDDPFPCPECGRGRTDIEDAARTADMMLSSRV
jgi:hypothetical protein